MFVTLRKNHSTMKHLSVFIFWGVPGSHVLVIRGRWFMTSRALAVLGLKELPAKIRRKRNLFRAAQTQTWNMWTFKCVYNPPNKFPISWFLFLFLLGGATTFLTFNIGFAESTLLGFGKEDFGRLFVEDEDSAWQVRWVESPQFLGKKRENLAPFQVVPDIPALSPEIG